MSAALGLLRRTKTPRRQAIAFVSGRASGAKIALPPPLNVFHAALTPRKNNYPPPKNFMSRSDRGYALIKAPSPKAVDADQTSIPNEIPTTTQRADLRPCANPTDSTAARFGPGDICAAITPSHVNT